MAFPQSIRRVATLVILLSLAAVAVAQDQASESPTTGDTDETTAVTAPVDPLANAQLYRERAKKLGARNNVPAAWSAYDKHVKTAEKDTLDAEELADLEEEGQRLVNKATYLKEIKDARGNLETLLGKYDRSLRQIAALLDVPLDPTLSGDGAAERLLDQLERDLLTRQVTLDSLRVTNRQLSELAGGRAAGQDSVITSLRVELSALRKTLWETELRAGVAEADRSAAESALTVRQAREQAVNEVVGALGDDADAVLAPDGTITLQVHGLNFAVGSANLASGQSQLMDTLAEVVGRFPDAEVRVEGHTDDTGSRSANQRLSKRRADTVAGGIERRLDRPEGSIATVGHGPDRPVAPNSTPEGRARNRRIDIVIAPPPSGF